MRRKVQIGSLWRSNFFGIEQYYIVVLSKGPFDQWFVWDFSRNKRRFVLESAFGDAYLWASNIEE